MKKTAISEDVDIALALMKGFMDRTGLDGAGDENQRYLWTDAFAVQNFFGLYRILKDDYFKEKAFRLIDLVHGKLGKFHPDDERSGWISGLTEEEGKRHPTAGGLRIGKKMAERGMGEAYHSLLEWERDGQYFHYITRWINALLQAHSESGEKKYGLWATELMLAGKNFIYKSGGQLSMYWKMSIDLKRPLVPSMGAHDPLEGLICALSAKEAAPGKAVELNPVIADFERLCAGQSWTTTDPLGIGGLLLNAVKSEKLAGSGIKLRDAVKPEKLYRESIISLKEFTLIYNKKLPAIQRLAFRECGLSLGIRAATGALNHNSFQREMEKYRPLAGEIEDFWIQPQSQNSPSWTEHVDINTVTLAASLIAKNAASAFT